MKRKWKTPPKKWETRRFDPEAIGQENLTEREDGDDAIYVDDMYGDWFLDYASYVILERAVPHADDGPEAGSAENPSLDACWKTVGTTKWPMSLVIP